MDFPFCKPGTFFWVPVNKNIKKKRMTIQIFDPSSQGGIVNSVPQALEYISMGLNRNSRMRVYKKENGKWVPRVANITRDGPNKFGIIVSRNSDLHGNLLPVYSDFVEGMLNEKEMKDGLKQLGLRMKKPVPRSAPMKSSHKKKASAGKSLRFGFR